MQNSALEVFETPEPTVASQTNSPDVPPPSKKRRVSFIQPEKEAPNATKSAVAVDSQPASPEAESTPEQEPTLLGKKSAQSEGDLSAELTSEGERKKKRKNKKEKKQLAKQNELSAGPPRDGILVEGEPQKKKKKKKKGALDNADLTATPIPSEKVKPTDNGKSSAPNGETDDVPQTKKLKKRSRETESNVTNETMASKNATVNSTIEPEAGAAVSETREKTTKKQKKSHTAHDDADDTAVNGTTSVDLAGTAASADALVPKTPKKARRKSDAQPPVAPALAKKQVNQESTGVFSHE